MHFRKLTYKWANRWCNYLKLPCGILFLYVPFSYIKMPILKYHLLGWYIVWWPVVTIDVLEMIFAVNIRIICLYVKNSLNCDRRFCEGSRDFLMHLIVSILQMWKIMLICMLKLPYLIHNVNRCRDHCTIWAKPSLNPRLA